MTVDPAVRKRSKERREVSKGGRSEGRRSYEGLEPGGGTVKKVVDSE